MNTTKTINIYLVTEMERNTPEATYEYMPPVILDNRVVIVPENEGSNFVDAWLSDSFVEDDYIVDNVRTRGINLSVNVELTDTVNDNFYIDIDRLKMFGELVIGLDANLEEDDKGYATFIDPVMVNTGSDLVEEAKEDTSVEDEELEDDLSSIEANVITEADESEEEPEWIVTYNLGEMLHEDISDETPSNEIILNAPDIETAIKYAEQNARIKAKEEPNWKEAEVISVKKKES